MSDVVKGEANHAVRASPPGVANAVDAESASPSFDAVRINALAYIERAGIVRVQVISIVTFQTKLVTVLRTIRAIRMLPVLTAADAKRAYVRRR